MQEKRIHILNFWDYITFQIQNSPKNLGQREKGEDPMDEKDFVRYWIIPDSETGHTSYKTTEPVGLNISEG